MLLSVYRADYSPKEPVSSPPDALLANKINDSLRDELCTTDAGFGDQNAVDSGFASADEHGAILSGPRTPEDCVRIHTEGNTHLLNDREIAGLVVTGSAAIHALERMTMNPARAVRIRRLAFVQSINKDLSRLPHRNYDYSLVAGRCAENVTGYIPVPLGVIDKLVVDGVETSIPLATTEGALIASISRGCKAINAGSGVDTAVMGDGMTRAPVVQFKDIRQAAAAKMFLETTAAWHIAEAAFNSTTSYGRLQSMTSYVAGRHMYIRFKATTGDAMGMNMLSRGTKNCLRVLQKADRMPDFQVISLSGNLCSDKKPAAINWICGRGKSIIAEARIPRHVLATVLKTDAERLSQLNTAKNHVGSALAGNSSGGFNAHAANIVAAMFLATGQDIAQTVVSSNCLTLLECEEDGDLRASVTMPSIEVGTFGGGTHLPAQACMLDILGVGRSSSASGSNATQLARIVAATVLAAIALSFHSVTKFKGRDQDSQSYEYAAYLANSLTGGIELRRHMRPLSEDVGTIRAQEDWNRLVSPLKGYTGGLGPRWSVMQLAFPECLPERLEVISYANELAFIYDDFTELFDQAKLEKANDAMQAAFDEGLHSGKIASPEGGLKQVQSMLWEEMRQIDEPRAQTAMKAWIEFLKESAGREHEVAHTTLKAFLPYRILDVGEMFLFGLVTFGYGVTIPDEEYDDVRRLSRPCWAVIALQNDIFSWDKELEASKRKGASHVVNALWVIMEEHKVNLEKATEICKEESLKLIDEYMNNVRREQASKRLSRDSLIYLEALLWIISANAVWSLMAPRYYPELKYNELQLEMMERGVRETLALLKVGEGMEILPAEDLNKQSKALKTYLAEVAA
ncbi:hypothetical protein CBER1_10250 [Cercospora berteroae]|uniref:hydroxymethylglutaryl-CoA reductase (NADPH) n=1 Tax=Cercospora berteroae TaxID=357750 RepID=A0A2S6BYH2_9PEZI|nr:hypothetical protein CBER1_10250 [Cercospora berteroae]